MWEIFQATAKRGSRLLRAMCLVTFSLAFASAVLVVALRLIHCSRPNLISWNLKSAIPLMLAGLSFACLQFVIPRTRAQVTLGLAVSAAFILWGIEQFVSSRAAAAVIDDIVVFLFVFDLSLVIRGHLKTNSDMPGTER
jgi:hypothetical protein